MKSRDCHVYFYLNELQLPTQTPSQLASNPDRLMATTPRYALLILKRIFCNGLVSLRKSVLPDSGCRQKP
jgi:hypothetical protein